MDYRQIPSFLHGCDYNAEQWLDRPEILEEDIRLMKKAHINVVTLGVFSWASLEPEEGHYTFEWLDQLMDLLYENGIYVILATPSAGKPPWLAKKYPEVMRTDRSRVHRLYGERENQCNSSPVFREKLMQIDSLLAQRYAHHPGLLMWHISNELYGECHCELCQAKFREWLQRKYGSLDSLNQQYWSRFWSHTYTNWDEIESPAPHGETAVHGLELDYRRFYSDQTIDLLRMEIETVRRWNPEVPVTHNLFHLNCGHNYAELANYLDIAAWDEYPAWHCGSDRTSDWKMAAKAAFHYDICRPLKQKPFLLMESTPSTTNGFAVCKLKRPGMHLLSAVEAIACGADSVQYFQWRKSRGAYEKFHGAVVSHNGSEATRVFRDVEAVGRWLEEHAPIRESFAAGAETQKAECCDPERITPDTEKISRKSEIAVIYDWLNIIALQEQKSLRRGEKYVEEIMMMHHEAILKNYTSVDVISQDVDYSGYKMILAPMLYLFEDETPGKIRRFVEQGGVFVTTFYSGLVNQNDLAYEGFPPYALNDVTGVKVEETDCICDDESNSFVYGGKRYPVYRYCDLLHAYEAEVLSEYESDFYQGMPALTRQKFGKGTAYYMACHSDAEFLYDFYRDLIRGHGICRITESAYVPDVLVKERTAGDVDYQFYMNFSVEERAIDGEVLPAYGIIVRNKKKRSKG